MEYHIMEFIVHYGYAGLVLILAGGVVGLPVPDELLLTFVGYNVSQGFMTYVSAVLCGLIGAMLGITISYLLGKQFGLPLLQKLGPKFGITDKRIQRTQLLFDKYGPFLLIIGYFLPGVRHLTAYFAGISSLGFRRFCAYAYGGAFIWVTLFVTLGLKLGDNWHTVVRYIHHYGVMLTITLCCVGALMWVYVQAMKNARES